MFGGWHVPELLANHFKNYYQFKVSKSEWHNIGIYYITNGKAIKITCEKTSRNSQTVYKDLDGNEIKVNDGNTFVQIVPIDANVTIE